MTSFKKNLGQPHGYVFQTYCNLIVIQIIQNLNIELIEKNEDLPVLKDF